MSSTTPLPRPPSTPLFAVHLFSAHGDLPKVSLNPSVSQPWSQFSTTTLSLQCAKTSQSTLRPPPPPPLPPPPPPPPILQHTHYSSTRCRVAVEAAGQIRNPAPHTAGAALKVQRDASFLIVPTCRPVKFNEAVWHELILKRKRLGVTFL